MLPFLLVIIIEVLLRTIGYGYNYRLFNEVKIKNKPDYLEMNPNVSWKYFKNVGLNSDNQSDLFLKTKTDSTFRVFVQGASTTVGFPFYHGGSFPRMLKHRLSKTFPEKNIEVINTGITAVNSYTLWDLTDEIIEQKPDLVIIYAGHNEYYGALGVGSSNSFGSHPMVVRSYLLLKEFRFFQLLDNGYTYLMNRKSMKRKGEKTNLMEAMAREQRIPKDSEVYQNGINQFENNLEKILKAYKENNIPVIISTVVSNEKDIKPFISDSLSEKNNFIKAVEDGNPEANRIAQKNAMAAYTLGSFYLEKKTDTAKKYLHLAKELDYLRFRAPEKINGVIENLSEKYDCSFVNMKTVFSSHSDQGIPGDELLLEHVHPNVKGYFVMSDAFYHKMRELNSIGSWDNYISFDDAFADMPITHIDSIKGNLIINDLKRSWPYVMDKTGTPVRSSFYSIPNPNYDEKRAFQAYKYKSEWRNIMIEAYGKYEYTKEYQKALRVAQSLILEYPEQGDGYYIAGTMCMKMNDPKNAIYYFFKSNLIDKTSESAQQLATAYLQSNQLDLAEKTLSEAKNRGSNDPGLDKMLKDLRSMK